MSSTQNQQLVSCDNGSLSQVRKPDSDAARDPAAADALAHAAETARDYMGQAKARNTLRGYRSDWRDFCAWCDSRTLSPLPAAPDTVVLYLAELAANYKVATLTRRVSAISQAHQIAGHDSPTDRRRGPGAHGGNPALERHGAGNESTYAHGRYPDYG